MANVLLTNLIVILGLLTLLWLVSVWLHDSSIIDPFWGFGFVVVAWMTRWVTGDLTQRGLLLCLLVTIWGLRLSSFLLWRNFGKGEDRRYVAMREARGRSFWWKSLFVVFWLQAILLWLISFPVQVVQLTDESAGWGWLDVLGAALWTIGFVFESVGDLQLARFKADPANLGRVFDAGLWRYTRHPNYFGDFSVWWGIYLISAAGGAWWTCFAPLLMSLFLMRVSGVTLLEQTITERRPAYADYIRRTNAFFPGPPKRG